MDKAKLAAVLSACNMALMGVVNALTGMGVGPAWATPEGVNLATVAANAVGLLVLYIVHPKADAPVDPAA